MNIRLKDRPFLAGKYSIADIACVGWASRYQRQGQDFNEFPHLKRWLDTVLARPAVKRGMGLRVEEASKVDMKDPKVQELLFKQRARVRPSRRAHCSPLSCSVFCASILLFARGEIARVL